MFRRAAIVCRAARVGAWFAIGLAACSDPSTTGVPVLEPAFAKGGGGGGGTGGTPVVDATDPTFALTDVRINVRVLGSNFDNGSKVRFLLNGKSVATMVVNATQFVSPSELVADLTVSETAILDLYDVEVTTSGGKKGIGIERFAVTAQPVTVTVVPTSPGLAPSPDNIYSLTVGGSLKLAPSCSSNDRLNLQGMSAAFNALGTRSTCNATGGGGFMFLKLWAGINSPMDAACNDQDAPQQTVNAWNFSPTSRYFFQVDGSDPDTKFDDTQYTLVLKDCWVHSVPGDPTARRVTASVGDLYAGQTGTPLAGFTNVPINVDLTFRP
jgi:hypothetical protein